MKTCPNCGELLGDSVNDCFKCSYSYIFKRVITDDEQASKRNREIEELKRKEEEDRKREEREKNKKDQLEKNPFFEYKVVIVDDLSTGQVNNIKMQDVLDEWSAKGWRLHSVFSSEVGKNSTAVSIAGIGTMTNETIDEIVLVFERCIKA